MRPSFLRPAASALAALCLLGSVARAEQRGSGWSAPVTASAPDEVKQAAAQADELYEARQQAGNDQKTLELLRAQAARHPESYDLQWRLARIAFWITDGMEGEKDKKRTLAIEGWEAGKKAVAANPKGAEGLYFMALCIGAYSHSVGILTALREGIESKFRDPLLEVLKLNDHVDHGGPYNALGRYKFELPWPKRDLDESVKYLRKSIEVNPQNLRGRVYLAESLAQRDDKGDVEEGKKLLQEVLAAPVGRYDTAGELRAKELAKTAAARLKWQL